MTDTAVATTTNKAPIVVLRERLEARKNELKNALVDVTPDAFIRALITSATINPDLQACSWSSLWNACMRACRDDLLPDGVQGAIVPFKSSAQWIPMYQGLMTRFRRSGQFKSVMAELVREGEEWVRYVDETGQHFRHVPGDNFDAPIVRVYAAATTKDGGFFLTVLPIVEANKLRNLSRAQRDDSPWKQFPEEMYKKTAIRRLSKMLPSSRDIIPEDDELPDPEPSPLAVASPPVARLSGTATLDHFAGNSRAVPTSAARAQEPVESQEPEPADPPVPTGTELETGDVGSAPGEIPDIPVILQRKLADAWTRGEEDRRKGTARKAVPPELRTPERSAEALAWAKGWVGEPLDDKVRPLE